MSEPAAAPARPSLEGLSREDYRELGAMLMTNVKQHDVPSLAAAVAFRVFFSLFPALFAAAGAFALVLSGAEVVALLDEMAFVPDGIRDTLEGPLVDFVEGGGGGASLAVVLGILVGLWSASSAAATLIKSLTRINGVYETRGFLTQRLIAIGIALAMFVVLVLLVLLLVAGNPLQRMIVEAFAAVELGGAAQAGFTVVRYAAAVAIVVMFFAFVFWVGPDLEERPPFQVVSPGALFGVLGWVLLSAAFGVYTSLAGEGGNPAAGLFGGAIVLLLWLQLSMLVLLLGAQLNAGLSELRSGGPATGQDSAGPPGAQASLGQTAGHGQGWAPAAPAGSSAGASGGGPAGSPPGGPAAASHSAAPRVAPRGMVPVSAASTRATRRALLGTAALAGTVAGVAWLRNRR